MNVNWFKNPDNVVYADTKEFIPNFEKETGITGLEEAVKELKEHPDAEGKVVVGKKRTSAKLMIPNLTFGEEIEMGENVWVYMGENYECYCLY